jgi:rfaE bifunctional protein kinase chain/domain
LRNFNSYRPATLITPNHHEALRMSDTEDHSDDGSNVAARIIQQKLGCDAVLITRGDRGMMLLEAGGQPVYVETAAREVYDVTGAGDTVIATLAAALASGATMLEAATLANHAAGIVVGKVGTATASETELIESF